ncbi:MAG: hypothetical protein ABR613_00875 [Actinomycetota bacterium]
MTQAWDRLKERTTYPAEPELACDVVMKGGITSGIAYPLAVCEIASRYKLVNVGGSSAGAIAAAAAAAAEVGRSSASGGFARLATLPQRLAGEPGARHSVLFDLFQPQPAMEPYYRILLAFVTNGLTKLGRIARAAFAAIRSFWLGGLLGAAAGLVAAALLVALAVRTPEVRDDLWSVLAVFVALLGALALAVAGGLGGLLVQAGRTGMRRFADNMFGICSGFLPAGPGDAGGCAEDQQRDARGRCGTKPLTTWLADEIDTLAGRAPTGADPLTFGDLCDRDVRLRMFTTNLSNGTPYTIPFKEVFYFHEDEMARLFPPRVVRWMVDNARQVSDETRRVLEKESSKLHSLPPTDLLPVVVATRMSLSFPMLLTAVPLWQVDWRLEQPYRCWFSDGGITSNFPVHFFDGPLPRRPTFGLNLGPFWAGEKPDEENQCANVYWPKSNNAMLSPRWSGIDTVGRFGRAIMDTMQNWSDNAQTRLPGYRDRIVLIKHTEDEGGMNLDMPRDRILRFAERGRCAGATLVAKFAGATPPEGDELGWDNHRWIRYRSTMGVLETFVEGWLRGFTASPKPSDRSYSGLIEVPVSYGWRGDQQLRGRAVTALLEALAEDWLEAGDAALPDDRCARTPEGKPSEKYDSRHPFRLGAPHPRPRLRITPDF